MNSNTSLRRAAAWFNKALQLTAAGRRGCNRRALLPPSLGLLGDIRHAPVIINHNRILSMRIKYLAPVVWLLLVHAQAQNLVTNPGFEAGNTGFASDYSLWPGPAINPNWGQSQYYMTNTPGNAYSGWLPYGDHTSGSGMMMVVDGSTNTGRAFWRETVSVVSNTMYVFSAWALKFDEDSPPILYFTVNGEQQGTFYVVPPAYLGWQNYGAIWWSGASNTAVLELRLQSNQAGRGNNIAVDDIALVPFNSVPAPTAAIEPALRISWPSYPGVPYEVQWRSALGTNDTWQLLGNSIFTGNGAMLHACDPLGTNARRFYRIAPLPP